MILMEGLLDYRNAEHDLANLYFFTGNSYVKRNGALVMGRGAARQVRDLYPGIDKKFGRVIPHLGHYGYYIEGSIGVFQVKKHFSAKAELDLIKISTEFLTGFAVTWPHSIYMNYPGIGNGGLLQTDVGPLLATLPDNVFIYRS